MLFMPIIRPTTPRRSCREEVVGGPYTPPMVDSTREKAISSPLLETKLFIPRPRAGLVARPRLIERLNQASAGKLTLVSAPAGFGKTTLLAEWLATAKPGKPRV